MSGINLGAIRLPHAAVLVLLVMTPLGSAAAQQPVELPFEFHGLVQIWLADAHRGNSTFRVRRTELKASGYVVERVAWTVQVDPSKVVSLRTGADSAVHIDNAAILQDAFLTYGSGSALQFDIGQFKLPLGREGLQSSATLEPIERALFAAGAGKYTDLRDIGLRARGQAGRFGWHAGLFNGLGESVNKTDEDHDKAAVGRAVVQLTDALSLGVSAAHNLGSSPDGTRQRFGADVLYQRHVLTVRGEVLGGRSAEEERLGYYLLVAYRWHDRWETVARYDFWDNAVLEQRDYLAGLSYRLVGDRAKLQLNVVHSNFDQTTVASRSVLLINAQAAW